MKHHHTSVPADTHGRKGIRLLFGLLLSAAITVAGCGGGGGSTTVAAAAALVGTNGQTLTSDDLSGFGIDGSNGGGFGSGDSGADGTGGEGGPINNGTVIITDVNGKVTRVKTNANGYYFAKVTGFTAPLLVKIVAQNGKIYNSLRTDALAAGVINTINITALTDKVASLVAGTSGVSALKASDITDAKVKTAKAEVLATFASALTAAGVDASKFDPINTPFKADGSGYDKLLDQVRHEINANGSTDLYSKGVAYAADGSVSSTPLSSAAPLALSSGKELNFARLDSLRKQYTACFAQNEAARDFNSASNACGGLVHPNYKSSAGLDYPAVVEQFSGRKNGNRVLEAGDVMTGAVFDAPELLLLESSTAPTTGSVAASAITDLDQAIIVLSWYQPANQSYRSTSALMRRFDSVAQSGGKTSKILNADGTSSNWWNYGGQGSYDYGINARLNRYTNLNPATNVPGTGTVAAPASASNDSSGLGLYVGTQKFNPATGVWDDSGVAYARVTGPGLPAVGVVVSRISAAPTNGVCVASDDLKYSTNQVASNNEATYLGFYSSTGVLPGSTATSTFTYAATSFTSTLSDFASTTPIGSTRTITFHSWTNIRQAPVTTTVNITVPGGPVASNTVVAPAAPATISFSISFQQTTASFGVSNFAATTIQAAGGVGSSVVTRSMLANSATNRFTLNRSAPNGTDLPFSANNSIFGINAALTPTDFAAIKPWSRYTFALYDAAGVLLSTEIGRLSVQPRPSQALRTMPLHDLSPSHALLTPARAAAASLDFKWVNNIAAPTPYQAFLEGGIYDGATVTPTGTVRRNSSARLKRQQLSTSGEAIKTFVTADVSPFTGCRLPVNNTAVAERLDTARTVNPVNPTTSNAIVYSSRSVGMNTSINRMRVSQFTAWEN